MNLSGNMKDALVIGKVLSGTLSLCKKKYWLTVTNSANENITFASMFKRAFLGVLILILAINISVAQIFIKTSDLFRQVNPIQMAGELNIIQIRALIHS